MASPGPSSASLRENLEDTRRVIEENIYKVSQHGERFDSLLSKSNNLADSAQVYRRVSTEKHREVWRKRKKLSFCIIGGIVFIAVVL